MFFQNIDVLKHREPDISKINETIKKIGQENVARAQQFNYILKKVHYDREFVPNQIRTEAILNYKVMGKDQLFIHVRQYFDHICICSTIY